MPMDSVHITGLWKALGFKQDAAKVAPHVPTIPSAHWVASPEDVLTSLLGMSPDEVRALADDGVLT